MIEIRHSSLSVYGWSMTCALEEDMVAIPRRTLAAGTAWAVPLVVLATAAPAMAASGPCALQITIDLPFRVSETCFLAVALAPGGTTVIVSGAFYPTGSEQAVANLTLPPGQYEITVWRRQTDGSYGTGTTAAACIPPVGCVWEAAPSYIVNTTTSCPSVINAGTGLACSA